MPKWTKEQLDAINMSGSNIIVSAGAGSGKTAVLTERVITKLKMGIKINELLILTFTNAAAGEMKERIRKKITEYPELKDNLDYIDIAYITTFDSFTLSLVKKYNYLLNVIPNLSIADESIINIYKNNLLDDIFNEFYQDDNPQFNKFISDFAIKNDTSIKYAILKIIKSLELISDQDEYLNNYLDNYFSEEKIDRYLKEYNNLLTKEIDNIETLIMNLENTSYGDYYENMVNCFSNLLKSRDYDEIKRNIPSSIPRRPRNSEDIIYIKEALDDALKKLKGYLRFKDKLEIVETLNISKTYIEVIIKIIKRYNEEINKYKFENDLYEFTDIELMAIKLLKDYDYIKSEVMASYKEILVDEYQDTNDLQEEFINLIANNNIYMVGDIKQSIYGFRNANPRIFKEKYDNYSKNLGGLKIDLLKNFRSRNEVLVAINKIFSLIMDNTLGGANYLNKEQMIFGNVMYEEHTTDQNYDLEIYNYHYEDKEYKKEEIEAFIIGRDIKNKIDSHYQVIDKLTGKLRDVRFEDFCLIMDRGQAFNIIKRIFTYLEIPLSIYEDKKLTNEIDIMLINNIIELILKIKDNVFDIDFKYAFTSIARSFLFNYSDIEIFEIIKNNSFNSTNIYEICLSIIKDIDEYDSYELLKRIVKDFRIYEKTVTVGNIDDTILRIDNLKTIARNLSSMGYSIEEFKAYLKEMINGQNEITYKGVNNSSNTVKIMNIHKSKGLEFPICYYCGFHKEFNTMDIKARFIYDTDYGIITPFFKEGIGSIILKDLVKEKYALNNIAEQIRLFYVALTRCKEKMIIVTSLDDVTDYRSHLVDLSIRSKYNSFLSIINSISGNLKEYIHNVSIDNLNITKDYMLEGKKNKVLNINTNEKIVFKNIDILNEETIKKQASKEIHKLLTNEEVKTLEYGTYLHKIFEETDFLNINKDNEYYEVINNFIKKLNINKDTLIYKEHEFIYELDNITYHGIIDLVLVDKDVVKLVDYKLKNIDDLKYIEQLKVYYNYLKTIFKQDIKVYLYSILDNNLKQINI